MRPILTAPNGGTLWLGGEVASANAEILRVNGITRVYAASHQPRPAIGPHVSIDVIALGAGRYDMDTVFDLFFEVPNTNRRSWLPCS